MGYLISINTRILIMNIKLYFIISLFFALLILNACTESLNNDETIYYFNENTQTKLSLIKPQNPKLLGNHSWMIVTEEYIYETNDLIVIGNVINFNELILEYIFLESDVKEHITIFEMKVMEIIYAGSGNNVKEGDIISIGVPYSSHMTDTSLPIIASGKEFLVFTYNTSELDNSIIQFNEFVEYWTRDPYRLLIEKKNDILIANRFFEEHQYVNSSINVSNLLSLIDLDESNFEIVNEIKTINSNIMNNDRLNEFNYALNNSKEVQKIINDINIDSVLTEFINRCEGDAFSVWYELNENYIFYVTDFTSFIKQRLVELTNKLNINEVDTDINIESDQFDNDKNIN